MPSPLSEDATPRPSDSSLELKYQVPAKAIVSNEDSKQVIWVGHVIQKVAATLDVGSLVRKNETKLRRTKRQTSLVESVRVLKKLPQTCIPALALDAQLELRLFPGEDDDYHVLDSRIFYGRMIILCLQKKRHSMIPDCARTLTGYFESGQWNTALYSALETIATNSEVIEALESAVAGPSSSSNAAARDVPNSSQVPSLITDECRTNPSTPTDTVRSMSAEAIPSARLGFPQTEHARDALNSLHFESAPSKLVEPNISDLRMMISQPIVGSTGDVHTSNTSPPDSCFDVAGLKYTQPRDSTVNVLLQTSAIGHDMAGDLNNTHFRAFAGNSQGDQASTFNHATSFLGSSSGGDWAIREQNYSADTCGLSDAPGGPDYSLTSGAVIDEAVLELLEVIKADLDTNKDRGYDPDSITSSTISHQSADSQNFAASLEHCMTHATPRINVIMSAEQAQATKDLYRIIEQRNSRRSTQAGSSSNDFPALMKMAPIPIMPPPGYQVVYHSPYPHCGYDRPHSLAESGFSAYVATSVSAHAISSSNMPRLPRLAPKIGRKGRRG